MKFSPGDTVIWFGLGDDSVGEILGPREVGGYPIEWTLVNGTKATMNYPATCLKLLTPASRINWEDLLCGN